MAGVLARMENEQNVNFIIAGDGPKRALLEEVREKRNMQNRITLLGAMDHSKVRFRHFLCQDWVYDCVSPALFSFAIELTGPNNVLLGA